MTLIGIMQQAMRQLGEDPADIADFRDMFIVYANEAYNIVVDEFIRPREARKVRINKEGYGFLQDPSVHHIIEVRNADGLTIPFIAADHRGRIKVEGVREVTVEAIVQARYDDMDEDEDEPRIPRYLHPVISDYICYRHLLNGNAAKQSHAMSYRQHFYEAMGRIRPDGVGRVTGYRNLYTVTQATWRG